MKPCAHDLAGQRLTQTLGNGASTTFIYDAASRTTRVAHLKPDGTRIELLNYTFDAANRRIGRTDLEGDRTTWTYDTAGQLSGEQISGPSSFKATYLYDNAGNRLSQLKNGDLTQYRYDAANRALVAIDTAAGRTSYSYDAAGNQTAIHAPAGSITTTIWDADSRQQAVEEPSGARVTFTYTCDHWRVSRDDGIHFVGYQWDKNNLLAETDISGNVQVQYANEPLEYGNLISQRQPLETVFYHFDAQGSTLALTDPAAAVTDRYLNDSWGNQLSSSGTTTNDFKWLGEIGYRFDTALQRYTLRRREYDAQLAKFFSPEGTVTMLAYIHGWQRRCGVMLLLMALAFSGLWSRAQVTQDLLRVRIGTNSCYEFMLFRNDFSWTRVTDAEEIKYPHSSRFRTRVQPQADPQWDNCGWRFAGFCIKEYTTPGLVTFRAWCIPYWWVILPLALFSALLLFRRPRKQSTLQRGAKFEVQ